MKYNEDLIKRQGITEEGIKVLDEIYERLKNVFEKAKASTDSKELACLSMQVNGIEFELQTAWGFEQDDSKHTYWYQMPGCECPFYDNREAFGTGMRLYNLLCPVHKDLLTHAHQSKMRH